MFELMAKDTPFGGNSPTEIYGKIFTGINKADFQKGMYGDCEELIKSLCHQLVFKRLTMTPGGIDNIKKHSWYKGFDWVALEGLSMQSPFIPSIKGKTDLSNFSKNIESKIPMECACEGESDGWDREFATSW